MKTALYIDDSMTSQQLTAKFLKDVCVTRCASNVGDALALMEKESFDILITDYLLEGTNGIGFALLARKIPGYQKTPIILVSGSLDRQLLSEAIQSGVNDCLAKPLKKEVVSQFVAKMLAEPYVRELDFAIYNIACVKWLMAGRHFQYCPAFGHRVEADTADVADAAMRAFLESQKSSITSDMACELQMGGFVFEKEQA